MATDNGAAPSGRANGGPRTNEAMVVAPAGSGRFVEVTELTSVRDGLAQVAQEVPPWPCIRPSEVLMAVPMVNTSTGEQLCARPAQPDESAGPLETPSNFEVERRW
jgi:hypothetical protein